MKTLTHDDLMAAAAEKGALADWRGAIRDRVVGVIVRGDGSFEAELVEARFGWRLRVGDRHLV